MRPFLALATAATLTACAPYKPVVEKPKVEHHDDTLSPFFEAAKSTHIVAFGETHLHSDKKIKNNTAKHFYTEILPEMAKLGYNQIVLEALWSDLYPTEIGIFNKTGKIHLGLSIRDNIKESPEPNLEEFLQACYTNHIKVIPGGVPNLFYKEASKPLESSKDKEALAMMAMLDGIILHKIKENSYKAIIEAAKYGKVMSYGGLYHNNIDKEREKVLDPASLFFEEERYLDLSFGAELAKDYPYLEVDLLTPEVLKATPMRPDIEYVLDTELARGSRKLKREGNRFKIVFPRAR